MNSTESLQNSLEYRDIHIWRILLDDPKWDDFARVLNDVEREKAARYRTMILQQRYRRCRSALRVILARYIGTVASNLVFQYGQYGKPTLLYQQLSFNVSHSGDYALLALAHHEHELGVDLEGTDKESRDLDGLIDMVCHPSEKASLAAMAHAEKAAQFYRLWTHKEAYCKMLGLGLYQSMAALYFRPASEDQVLQAFADDHTPAPSYLYQLDAQADFSASLCVPLAQARITYFTA